MKKTFLLSFVVLMTGGFISVNAQNSVTVPETGTNYSLVLRAGGLTLTRSTEDFPQIKANTGDYDQAFEFEAIDGEAGAYYIKNAYDNDYLVCARPSSSDTWTMGWVKDPAVLTESRVLSDAKYMIEALESGYVLVKNLGSNSYVGADNIEDGSALYANKGNGEKSQWTIKAFTTEVDKEALILKIAEANALYNRTSAGSGSDQYPETARTALKNKIDAAQAIFDDGSANQIDVNDALLELTDAYLAYIDSVNPLQPSTTDLYSIINYNVDANGGKLYFSAAATVVNPTYETSQQFKFFAVEGKTGTYNLQVASTESFLTREANGWNYTFAEDPTTDLAQFQLKNTGTSTDADNQLYRIWNIASGAAVGDKTAANSYAGIDELENGRPVFADKNGKDIRHHWYISIQREVVKTGLESAIATVNAFLLSAVRGEGQDQYPAAEYDALIAAKTVAEETLNNANATQSEVGTATTALNDALAACIAAVHPMLPALNEPYYIIHSSSFAFGEYSEGDIVEKAALLTFTGEDNQRFLFSSVQGYPDRFNITIASLGQYMTRDNTAENDYKLFWGSDPDTEFAQFIIKRAGNGDYYTVQCVTPGPTRTNSFLGTDDNVEFTGVWIDKNGKDGKHYWTVVKAGGSDGIKYTAADKAVVYSYNNQLTVRGLQGQSQVLIYTINGQLVSTMATNNVSYSKALASGNYIVVVNGKSSYRGVIIVK